MKLKKKLFRSSNKPPPFSSAVNGKRQTFPNPTDKAMHDSRNSMSFSHLSFAINCSFCHMNEGDLKIKHHEVISNRIKSLRLFGVPHHILYYFQLTNPF